MTISAATPNSTLLSAHENPAQSRRRIKAILVGSIGNLIEWYDVYAYSAFALYFAPSFFPASDPVAQQLSAAIVFAAAFVIRPLGGIIFGWIADRMGRRRALMISVLLMCFGSLLIAVSPTYAQIGVGATAILITARLLQGLSQGGEYGASATYLSEMAASNPRVWAKPGLNHITMGTRFCTSGAIA